MGLLECEKRKVDIFTPVLLSMLRNEYPPYVKDSTLARIEQESG
jgi:hypothetical protein